LLLIWCHWPDIARVSYLISARESVVQLMLPAGVPWYFIFSELSYCLFG